MCLPLSAYLIIGIYPNWILFTEKMDDLDEDDYLTEKKNNRKALEIDLQENLKILIKEILLNMTG